MHDDYCSPTPNLLPRTLLRRTFIAGRAVTITAPPPHCPRCVPLYRCTAGHPKGVMLSHANLMYQVCSLSFFLDVHPGESVLSLLPPWHIYERTCSYFVLARGLKQVRPPGECPHTYLCSMYLYRHAPACLPACLPA